MSNIEKQILDTLKENADVKYKDFSAKLTPTIDKSKFIGVRVPILRKIAKQYSKNKDIEKFLTNLPHNFVEENTLHGLIISEFKDYDFVIKNLNAFLPYVDNWATCDIINPKIFKKFPEKLKENCKIWMSDKKPFTIRFGIEMVMTYFLDDNFDKNLMTIISKIKNDEYYVKMMIAWYFATALAKQWESALTYIENKKLDAWTHNKTIQKAVESYRITPDQKSYLKTLKIPKKSK